MNHSEIQVRDALEADMPYVQEIYAWHVAYGTGTFEEAPPSTAELVLRRAEVVQRGLPYLVAVWNATVVGYAYANSYRARSAYRYTIEDSVYVAHGMERRGVGAALLRALIERCEQGPWRQMLAVIGDSANDGSVALHRRFGFVPIGTLSSVGFKFGGWVDTVVMQRALGDGNATLPPGAVPS